MFEMLKYGHLSAKIRSMKGKMLKANDYAQLLQKNSVRDVANYLKNETYYHEVLKDLDESDVHRGYLEILLQQTIISDALKISKYLGGNEKKVFRFIYRKQEIEDIKKMLRALTIGQSLVDFDRRVLFINQYSRIDYKIALASRTIRDFVDSLKSTKFYGILSPLVKQDTEIDLFAAEMALDLYYYESVFKQMNHNKTGLSRSMVENVFMMEADLKNIFMIYRGKKYYDVTKEVLHLYLIPHYYKFKKNDFDRLIDASSAEEVVQILLTNYYGTKIKFDSENWEQQFHVYIQHAARLSMLNEPYSISPLVGYIYLKEIESMNITTIVEGIRYNVEPTQIKELLVYDFD